MSAISVVVDRINTISGTLFYLEGHIARLQAERSAAFLALDQLHSAQRDAHENGHKWPGPTREELEAAQIAHRDARLDLAHALADRDRYMSAMGEAQAELQVLKLARKREQRNRPLTTRPFAALLG